MSTDPWQDRKVDSLAGIRQSSSHGKGGGTQADPQQAADRQAEQQQKNGFPQAQRHEGGFSGTDHTQSDKALLPAAQLQGAQHEHRAQGQQGTKKSAAPKNGALPA